MVAFHQSYYAGLSFSMEAREDQRSLTKPDQFVQTFLMIRHVQNDLIVLYEI